MRCEFQFELRSCCVALLQLLDAVNVGNVVPAYARLRTSIFVPLSQGPGL
jgi:hypothetical protein